jgi:hypothetical protein
MSGHIQEYWKDLKSLEETLPEFVWLVATAAGAPPFVTQVACRVAAKLLHARTHRIAADEEVAAQRAKDTATLKQAKQERMRRSGAAVVVVDEEASPESTTSEPSPRRRR